MDNEEKKNVLIESVSASDNQVDILAENNLLKHKLQETEAKLIKFKNFVVTLRNERNQLTDKVGFFLFFILFNHFIFVFFSIFRLTKIIV